MQPVSLSWPALMNDWRRTTLGHVAAFVGQKVDPQTVSPLTHYVGLEHLVGGSPRVHGRGLAGDVISLVSVFDKHDVLFGRLRPYLRKVALAEASGVCSPEILVLRANESDVSPGYLLFLVSSESAIGRAVRLSAGSRMPRTSPADLASMPITVPPLPVQQRIVGVVGAFDANVDALNTELQTAETALTALREHLLAPEPDWQHVKLGDVAELRIGRTPSRNEASYWTESLAHPFITIGDMDEWAVGAAREGVTEAAIQQGKAKGVPSGSLVMSFKLSIGRVGITDREVFPNEAIVWINPTAAYERDYLAHWLGSHDLTGGTVRAVKGATLNSKSLAAIPVALPRIERQREIVSVFEAQREAIRALGRELSALREARAQVLNALVSREIEIPASYDVLREAAA